MHRETNGEEKRKWEEKGKKMDSRVVLVDIYYAKGETEVLIRIHCLK